MRGMIDVCTGPMTLERVHEEIFYYMYHKAPKRLVIEIKHTPDGYHATLWMSKADFENPWQSP